LPVLHDRLGRRRQLLQPARGNVVLEVDEARRQPLLQRLDDQRANALDAGVGDLHHHHVVVQVDHQPAQLVALGVNEPHGVRLRAADGVAARDGGVDARADDVRGQLITERERAHADLRVQRVEARRDAHAARVDQVGDRRVVRSALVSDGAGEDPRVPVADHPLLARLQRQDAAAMGIEFVHAARHYNRRRCRPPGPNSSTPAARKMSIAR